ncbi:sensor histidine kinase [Thermodesulfobacteriota bacterium]
MKNILDTYRTLDSEKDISQRIAMYLKDELNCEAVTIFTFNEAAQNLEVTYSTSKKLDSIPPVFDFSYPVYDMLESEIDKIISQKQIEAGFPTIDTFFEDISLVHSMVYSRVFDSLNKPISLIRAINKLDHEGNYVNFRKKDLELIISVSNILGSALSAKYASQRMMAFLDSVTHELLAPTTGIKNIAKFLSRYIPRHTNDDPKSKTQKIIMNIDDIKSSAEMAIALVDGLTMFSKSGRIKKTELNIRPVLLYKHVILHSVNDLLTLIKARGFSARNIVSKDFHKWPRVAVDQPMMKQVFTNLFSNSIKYAWDDKDAFSITIQMKKTSSNDFEVTIEDYGIGIDPKTEKTLFLPGVRGRNAQEKVTTGTGIGLTTVKNLLELHGMTIKLKSLSNPTTFCVKIPEIRIIKDKR